jgi:hypothetical protein
MLKAAITYYQACSLDLNSQEQLFRSNQMIVGQEGRKGRRQRRRQTASSGVSLVRGLLVSGRRRAGTRVLMPLTTRQPATTTPSLLDHHQPSCVLPPIHSTSSQAGEKKKKNPTASRFACGCFRIPPASSLGDSRQRPPPPPPRRPPPIKSRPFFLSFRQVQVGSVRSFVLRPVWAMGVLPPISAGVEIRFPLSAGRSFLKQKLNGGCLGGKGMRNHHLLRSF